MLQFWIQIYEPGLLKIAVEIFNAIRLRGHFRILSEVHFPVIHHPVLRSINATTAFWRKYTPDQKEYLGFYQVITIT